MCPGSDVIHYTVGTCARFTSHAAGNINCCFWSNRHRVIQRKLISAQVQSLFHGYGLALASLKTNSTPFWTMAHCGAGFVAKSMAWPASGRSNCRNQLKGRCCVACEAPVGPIWSVPVACPVSVNHSKSVLCYRWSWRCHLYTVHVWNVCGCMEVALFWRFP